MAEGTEESQSAPSPRTIPIRLSTKSTSHAIPEARYMVPADWRRYQLSELINKVLGYPTPVPFDFILSPSDTLLRTSLSSYITSQGLSDESTLEIEYLPSVLPPTRAAAFEQDDWISDVDLSRQGRFLSSSYSSQVSLTSLSSSRVICTFGKEANSSHTEPVLAVCWVGGSSDQGTELENGATPHGSSNDLVASGGMDRVIKVWELPPLDPVTITSAQSAKLRYTLSHHESSVSSLHSRPSLSNSAPNILSCDWSGSLAYWTISDSSTAVNGSKDDEEVDEDDPSTRAKKRRKGNAIGSSNSGGISDLAPTSTLKAHSGKISRAIFDRSKPSKSFSAGWDHAVKGLDWEVEAILFSKTCDSVLMDLDQMAGSGETLATGNFDTTVALWDTREEIDRFTLTMRGHHSPVSSVCAHPTNSTLLVSGSYDASLRIWDIRSPKQALFVIDRQDPLGDNKEDKTKVLCVDWNGDLIASGGEDKKVQFHTAKMPAA